MKTEKTTNENEIEKSKPNASSLISEQSIEDQLNQFAEILIDLYLNHSNEK
jgi:hypothetical protein